MFHSFIVGIIAERDASATILNLEWNAFGTQKLGKPEQPVAATAFVFLSS
jgi:hypothetical protein